MNELRDAPHRPQPAAPSLRTRILLVGALSSIGLLLWLVTGFGPEPVPELPPATDAVRVLVREEARRMLLTAEGGFVLEGHGGAGARLGPSLELRDQAEGFVIVQPATAPQVIDAERLFVRWDGPAEARFDEADEPQRWYGALALVHGPRGMRVIPHVELERYLSGVLAKEMSASFTPAALAAQAVAARSYVLESKTRARERDYDVFGDTRSQVYRGASEHPRILRAIAATAGLVLRHDGRLLRCYYSSTCGGRTRGGAERFGDVPAEAMPSVECRACAISPAFEWDKELAPGAWSALGLDAPPASIEVLARSPRGDWLRVRCVQESGGAREFSGSELRQKLGLRSTWITDVTRDGELHRVYGRGFGHGVGLCQWGAEGYGRRGWTWQQILAHYYPGAQLGPYRAEPEAPATGR